MSHKAGFGVPDYRFAFAINNRPPLDDYPNFVGMRALQTGELGYIVNGCSNHWRKVFNVFAKFAFELGWPEMTGNHSSTWQEYRDCFLLQATCQEALLFSSPLVSSNRVHIVAGKTYGFTLPWAAQAVAISEDIWVYAAGRCVICPYLDYRQLNNQKISRVAAIVKPWLDAEV